MQWYQLDHKQTICTLLQTDNHTSTPSLDFYRQVALPDAQPCQSTEGKFILHLLLKVDKKGYYEHSLNIIYATIMCRMTEKCILQVHVKHSANPRSTLFRLL